MITVIISTSRRLHYLKKTLSDLIYFKDIIDRIIIISFNDLNSYNYVKQKFKSIFKEITTIKSRNNFEFENRIKNLSTIDLRQINKSQYLWFMSDKDRILTRNINYLKMILKRNISGLTMNVHSLKSSLNFKNKDQKYYSFILNKGVHKLGLISSQILSKRLFLKYSKKTNISPYYLSEIILKIIINEKNWFFLKQKVIGYTHLNKDKNRDKLSLKYISYRMEEEFEFYLFKLDKILSRSKYKNKNKIINKAFFKNIISWLVLFKEKENQLNFSKTILRIRDRIIDYKILKLILFLIIYTPTFILNILKKIKNIK